MSTFFEAWKNKEWNEYQNSSGQGKTSGYDSRSWPEGLDHGALVCDAVDVVGDVPQAGDRLLPELQPSAEIIPDSEIKSILLNEWCCNNPSVVIIKNI